MRTLASVPISVVTICFLLVGAPVLVCSDEQHATPKVELEIVRTDVDVQGKVDLFLLATNPNDFDVYVFLSSTGRITGGKSGGTGDGMVASEASQFSMVAAKSKLLCPIERGYALNPGMNHVRIEVSGVKDPKAKLPWNYVCMSYGGELAVSNDRSR